MNLDNHAHYGVHHWDSGDTAAGGQGQTVAGIECFPTMHEEFHVHAHLSIILNGQDHDLTQDDPAVLAIPSDVGIVENSDGTRQCIYSLHTHDNSGMLHVEAPAPGTFTLGQYFDIWGQPLSDTNVAGLVGMPIVVYLTESDGTTTIVPDHWRDIELTSHRLITIQVGSPISKIPNFTWTGL